MVKRKENRSAAIREIHKSNPKLSPKEIVEQMAKKGMETTSALVYNVLRNEAGRTTNKVAKKRGRKPASASVTVANSNVEIIAAVKSFVQATGGLDNAIEILQAIKSL